MLLNLHVKNLALIDEIEVEFGDHLNILTGETGAGKSILLGSMNAALGNKISKDMIRPGESYALVELLFHIEQPEILKKLEELDIAVEEGEVLISRKILNRRNICKVNGTTVTVPKLKEIASMFIDIHSQHEHQSLLHKNQHLKILDEFSKKESLDIRKRIQKLYEQYADIKHTLEEDYSDQEKIKRALDVVLYEINKKSKKVTIMDPAKGKKIISFSEFNLLTSNNYLFLKPYKTLPVIKKNKVITKLIKESIKSNKKT